MPLFYKLFEGVDSHHIIQHFNSYNTLHSRQSAHKTTVPYKTTEITLVRIVNNILANAIGTIIHEFQYWLQFSSIFI